MIVLKGDELYYITTNFINQNKIARLYSNIEGAGETIFIGAANIHESVGNLDYVRGSYTVGWAKTLTSDLGTTISSAFTKGIVLPSHVSKSCISDSHDSLTVSVNSMPDAVVLEIAASGNNGVFEVF